MNIPILILCLICFCAKAQIHADCYLSDKNNANVVGGFSTQNGHYTNRGDGVFTNFNGYWMSDTNNYKIQNSIAKTNFLPENFYYSIRNYAIYTTNDSVSRGCVTQYGSGRDGTNIVILKDFHGTIQVGDTFYHISSKTNVVKKIVLETNVVQGLIK